MNLYKYRSLEGAGREYAEDLLFNGNFYLSRVDEFNDPFEFEFELLRKDVSTNRKSYEKIRNDLIKEFRVFCFSDNWRNNSLWSNYANSHKGICIEFSGLTEKLKEHNINVKKVLYSETLPQVQLCLKAEELAAQIKDIFSTKQKVFNKESEHRIIHREKDGECKIQVKNISKLIPRVFVGVNFDISDPIIDKIKTNLHETKIFKLEKAQKEYSLNISEEV